MSPTDFDDIAALWQREPSPEEELAFQLLARRASRRARMIDLAERGFAAFLVGAVLIALLLSSRPATIAIGILTAVAVGWSAWKRHLLNEVKAMVRRDDRRAFIDAATAQAGAALRRSAIGLWLLLPGILLGALLIESFRGDLDLRDFGENFIAGITRWPVGPLTGLIVLASLALMLRAHRRMATEYRRLKALQVDYEHEERLDASNQG